MTTPLAGITVIDFGQIFQGPYATLLMAKAGADVIKIEPPQGEPLRRRAAAGQERDLAVRDAEPEQARDHVEPEARARPRTAVPHGRARRRVARKFLARHDGRARRRLERAAARSTRASIYASGTGFGISGPDRDNLAMDMTIQAASGIMSVTGFPDGPPVKAGPTVVDFMGGIHLYAAHRDRALRARPQRGGPARRGGDAGGRLCDPGRAATEYYYRTGKVPPRTGNRQPGWPARRYNVYPTNDGHVAIHIVTEEHWQNLLKAMGREELRDDPRFATNAARVAHMDETDALVAAWTRTLRKMEVFAQRQAATASRCAPVRNVARGHARPAHARARHARTDRAPRDRPDRRADHAVAPARRRQGRRCPSPKLGQHNAEIYGGWLGLSPAEITELSSRA